VKQPFRTPGEAPLEEEMTHETDEMVRQKETTKQVKWSGLFLLLATLAAITGLTTCELSSDWRVAQERKAEQAEADAARAKAEAAKAYWDHVPPCTNTP